MTRRVRIPLPTPITFPTHARRQRDFTAAFQRTVGPLVDEARSLYARQRGLRRIWPEEGKNYGAVDLSGIRFRVDGVPLDAQESA
jgi:hypothetical protein